MKPWHSFQGTWKGQHIHIHSPLRMCSWAAAAEMAALIACLAGHLGSGAQAALISVTTFARAQNSALLQERCGFDTLLCGKVSMPMPSSHIAETILLLLQVASSNDGLLHAERIVTGVASGDEAIRPEDPQMPRRSGLTWAAALEAHVDAAVAATAGFEVDVLLVMVACGTFEPNAPMLQVCHFLLRIYASVLTGIEASTRTEARCSFAAAAGGWSRAPCQEGAGGARPGKRAACCLGI